MPWLASSRPRARGGQGQETRPKKSKRPASGLCNCNFLLSHLFLSLFFFFTFLSSRDPYIRSPPAFWWAILRDPCCCSVIQSSQIKKNLLHGWGTVADDRSQTLLGGAMQLCCIPHNTAGLPFTPLMGGLTHCTVAELYWRYMPIHVEWTSWCLRR